MSKNKKQDTIAAVATAAGTSALAVIRVSGGQAKGISDLLFAPLGKRFLPIREMKPYTLSLGYWYQDELQSEKLDQVLISYFQAPNSYTGEDLIEISCHGGTAVKSLILKSLFAQGVRQAEPGEFTQRAFLNQKLDLVEAEGVIDLINSESESQQKAAMTQLSGALSRQINHWRQELFHVLAGLELAIEFPEQEAGQEQIKVQEDLLINLRQELALLQAGFKRGQKIREGLGVVLLGLPNSGKSSLFNHLLGYDRAIVTSTAGTTRDTVSEDLVDRGILIRLTDTAGFRASEDKIEQMGVKRAIEASLGADLVLFLIPSKTEIKDFQQEYSLDLDFLAQVQEKQKKEGYKILVLGSKADLGNQEEFAGYLKDLGLNYLLVDLNDQKKLDHLFAQIHELAALGPSLKAGALIVANLRQQESLNNCAQLLDQAIEALQMNLPLDIVASLAYHAAEALASITGDDVSEELASTIFSRFCVGK